MSKSILYISSLFEEKDVDSFFYDKGKISYAANKYNQMMCSGFAHNDIHVRVFGILPLSHKNSKKMLFLGRKIKSKNIQYDYIPIFNLPIIKNILTSIIIFFKTLFSGKQTAVIFDLFATSANIGMLFATKFKRIKKICILTDFPKFIRDKKAAACFSDYILKKLIDDSDGYILVTKQMEELLDLKNRKTCIVEGLVYYSADNNKAIPHDFSKSKKVMYAGALEEIYGIKTLLDAFENCGKEDEELHLFGAGHFENEVIARANKVSSIYYHGSLKNTVIMEKEKSAILLVNPRTSEGIYTKYSFPSKVIEYMSSGTPVLMARLPGIPNEYYEHCYSFDDHDPHGLEKSLRAVLDKPPEELQKKGKEAAEFVFYAKNNKAQCRKIAESFGLL